MHIKTGALAAVSFVLFVAVICYAVYVTITMAGSRERNERQLEQIVRMNTLEDVYQVTKGIKRDLT